MKIIKSEVSVLEQQPGIEGMFKHIERVGRLAYKSEDRITEDSWKKFVKMIYERGHHAVFNLGTVYLSIPKTAKTAKEYEFFEKITEEFKPWTKWSYNNGYNYVTTNFRVICQTGTYEEMVKYWCEPTEHHYHRVTAHWICSRGTATQILRHRFLSPVMESQRYCSYNKNKFGGELTYVLPQWIYDVRQDCGTTIDSLTGKTRNYLLDLDGQELWDQLICCDRKVASRDRFFKAAEEEYMYELSEEDGKLNPEDARGVLPQDIKTELCTCGYVEDWMFEPNPDSTEKAGFFYLRTAKDAQRDIRVLACKLKNEFIEKNIDKQK